MTILRTTMMMGLCLSLTACGGFGLFGGRDAPVRGQSAAPAAAAPVADLYPGETPQMRALVNEYAARHDIPVALLHRVIQRESDYRADARAGPYYGCLLYTSDAADE